MIRRFTGQEIFIIFSALCVLMFMYVTIIISAPMQEVIDNIEEPIIQDVVAEQEEITEPFYAVVETVEDEHE
ncbi:hypothetical protein [Halalkalibacter krulwichiae]|uniref:Uncharacterized protein n=1 Tax=Halalkalibacter krulwichiae TaxID=199441 RepID=A0A1X9MBW7_9BACI|nr:hypothetical protein [Halalkalibacter krulwichiae]ARK30906.1 hypothetical protein BkAM31D_14245 [Halalkalibacter krulwichiae]